eukprot:1113560-Rhodomonas_salina.1
MSSRARLYAQTLPEGLERVVELATRMIQQPAPFGMLPKFEAEVKIGGAGWRGHAGRQQNYRQQLELDSMVAGVPQPPSHSAPKLRILIATRRKEMPVGDDHWGEDCRG